MTKKRLIVFVILCLLFFAGANCLLQPFLKTGLRKYYCLTPSDVLVVGHSMAEMSIDRNLLVEKLGVSVSKYCMNGAGTADRLVMIKHYIESTRYKPKYVLYDISGRSFSSGLSNSSYALFFPFMDESSSVDYYSKSNASPGEYWRVKLIPLCRYDDTRLGAVVRGWRGDWRNRSIKHFDVDNFRLRLSLGAFWHITLDTENMCKFDETLEYLYKENIKVILLALPCVDLLNDAEPELYKQVFDFISSETEKYPNVQLIDFNAEFSKRYELFADPIHLNPTGQRVVTIAVAEQLLKILKN